MPLKPNTNVDDDFTLTISHLKATIAEKDRTDKRRYDSINRTNWNEEFQLNIDKLNKSILDLKKHQDENEQVVQEQNAEHKRKWEMKFQQHISQFHLAIKKGHSKSRLNIPTKSVTQKWTPPPKIIPRLIDKPNQSFKGMLDEPRLLLGEIEEFERCKTREERRQIGQHLDVMNRECNTAIHLNETTSKPIDEISKPHKLPKVVQDLKHTISQLKPHCIRLYIYCHKASNLPHTDSLLGGGLCDGYLSIGAKSLDGDHLLAGCSVRTRHVVNTLDPVWDEEVVIDLPFGKQVHTTYFEFCECNLHFQLFDYDRFSSDEKLGWFHLKLSSALRYADSARKQEASTIPDMICNFPEYPDQVGKFANVLNSTAHLRFAYAIWVTFNIYIQKVTHLPEDWVKNGLFIVVKVIYTKQFCKDFECTNREYKSNKFNNLICYNLAISATLCEDVEIYISSSSDKHILVERLSLSDMKDCREFELRSVDVNINKDFPLAQITLSTWLTDYNSDGCCDEAEDDFIVQNTFRDFEIPIDEPSTWLGSKDVSQLVRVFISISKIDNIILHQKNFKLRNSTPYVELRIVDSNGNQVVFDKEQCATINCR